MCHVLIIEDEWLIAEHISGLAEDGGATSITITTTEREAVEAARERRPDLILSDVRLAEGTGPAAVGAIRALPRRAPAVRGTPAPPPCRHDELGTIAVIFITGTPEECRPRSASAVVLTKPIDNAAVLSAFRRLAPL